MPSPLTAPNKLWTKFSRFLRPLLRPPWKESSGFRPWLILALAAGLAIAFFRHELGSPDWIKQNKDQLAGLSSITTMLAISIAGLLSYLRFFRGRWLLPKLTIAPSAQMIPAGNENIFWIDVALENKGTVSIWNHKTVIKAIFHYKDATQSLEVDVTEYFNYLDRKGPDEYLIDVGETSFEHALLRVPKDAVAVTFVISVTDQNGTAWNRGLTCSNVRAAEQSV